MGEMVKRPIVAKCIRCGSKFELQHKRDAFCFECVGEIFEAMRRGLDAALTEKP